jgi:hypothetical protein
MNILSNDSDDDSDFSDSEDLVEDDLSHQQLIYVRHLLKDFLWDTYKHRLSGDYLTIGGRTPNWSKLNRPLPGHPTTIRLENIWADVPSKKKIEVWTHSGTGFHVTEYATAVSGGFTLLSILVLIDSLIQEYKSKYGKKGLEFNSYLRRLTIKHDSQGPYWSAIMGM